MKIQAALLRDELCRIAEAQAQIPPYRPEFPRELSERVVEYVLQQRRRGKTLAECAQELGQPKSRLHYWLYQRKKPEAEKAPTPSPGPTPRAPVALRPVQVTSQMVTVYDGVPERRYILRSPSGWELKDLSLVELVELLRSLV
jgi:hypothetical protein